MAAAMTATAGLPGLVLPDRAAGSRPRRLLAEGVLLLRGVAPGRPAEFGDHRRLWGTSPDLELGELITVAEGAEIVGAGGAGFPLARKLASMFGARVSHVIVNAAEGESASGKDGVLLTYVPHLVLDAAVATARALGAPRVVVRIPADRTDLVRSLPRVIAQRHEDRVPIEVSIGPVSFVAGEASAVIRALAGGPALPAELGRPPRLPGRGLRRRPLVMLSNVETFARLGLAMRGIDRSSALVSVSGAVQSIGVLELPATANLADLASAAGGLVGRPRVVLTGGWHGRWLPWGPVTASAPLTRAGVAGVGGRWGAGAFVWVPEDLPTGHALAAVAAELAAGTAEQCGPCWRGLPAVADLLDGATRGAVDRRAIEDVLAQVDGRGICAHPSASVAALRSGLDLMEASA